MKDEKLKIEKVDDGRELRIILAEDKARGRRSTFANTLMVPRSCCCEGLRGQGEVVGEKEHFNWKVSWAEWKGAKEGERERGREHRMEALQQTFVGVSSEKRSSTENVSY